MSDSSGEPQYQHQDEVQSKLFFTERAVLSPERVYDLIRLNEIRSIPKTRVVQVALPSIDGLKIEVDDPLKDFIVKSMATEVLPFLGMGCVLDGFGKDDPARDPIYIELRDGIEDIDRSIIMQGTNDKPLKEFIKDYSQDNQLRGNKLGKVSLIVNIFYAKLRKTNPLIAQDVKQQYDSLKSVSKDYGEKTDDEKLQVVNTYQNTILSLNEFLFGKPEDAEKTLTYTITDTENSLQKGNDSEL